MRETVELYNILSESDTNLRQPVGMENQLLKDNAMDSDVAQSMLQLLQVNITWLSLCYRPVCPSCLLPCVHTKYGSGNLPGSAI